MITDRFIQHELLKTALEATDNYLALEKKALAANMVTNAMLHDFSYHMTRAHEALQALGVLDQHEEYMKSHVDTMLKLHGHKDSTIGDLPYTHVPKADYGEVEEAVWDNPSPRKNPEKLSPEAKARAKARAKAAGRPYPNAVDNIWAARKQKGTNEEVVSFIKYILEEKKILDEELTKEELDRLVDDLTWEDVVDLYTEAELVYDEDEDEGEEAEEEDEDEEDEEDEDEKKDVKEEYLEERLTVQSRLRKRQAFARMRGKRNVARSLKLRRPSNISVLKKRAVLAARRAVYKRLLRGRDKATLSAAEKDRVEQQVSRLKYIQASLATRFVSKMRQIEQKRIANARTKAKLVKPSKAPKTKSTRLSYKPSKAPKGRK